MKSQRKGLPGRNTKAWMSWHRPERIEQIKHEEAARKVQAARRRRPKTLAEAFTGDFDEEDEHACLICQL